jgi:hypothetical protein
MRSTDSDASTVPEELTTLSNGCEETITPRTVIPPPPLGRGAGSLFFDAQDVKIREEQRTVKNRNTRNISFMVSKFLFCKYEE